MHEKLPAPGWYRVVREGGGSDGWMPCYRLWWSLLQTLLQTELRPTVPHSRAKVCWSLAQLYTAGDGEVWYWPRVLCHGTVPYLPMLLCHARLWYCAMLAYDTLLWYCAMLAYGAVPWYCAILAYGTVLWYCGLGLSTVDPNGSV